MENNNVFDTPVYNLKDYANKKALEDHLEFKINAVVELHASVWDITNIERKITDTTASAKISMKRKQ